MEAIYLRAELRFASTMLGALSVTISLDRMMQTSYVTSSINRWASDIMVNNILLIIIVMMCRVKVTYYEG